MFEGGQCGMEVQGSGGLECEKQDLEVKAKTDLKPVKLFLGDTLSGWSSRYDTCSQILD